jgi:hypothetical protein
VSSNESELDRPSRYGIRTAKEEVFSKIGPDAAGFASPERSARPDVTMAELRTKWHTV